MGRNMMNGIATRIEIQKRNPVVNYDIIKNKNMILKEINKFVNVENYNCTQNENGDLTLEIKMEFFNDNIHDLIKETRKIMKCENILLDNMFDKKEIDYKKFNNVNYPLQLKKYDENYKYAYARQKEELLGTYYLESNIDKFQETGSWFPSNYWLFQENKDMFYNLTVQIFHIPLWIDIGKIIMEDESFLLHLINRISRNHFKNPLSKDILFFIGG